MSPGSFGLLPPAPQERREHRQIAWSATYNRRIKMNNAINTSDIIFVDAADYESVTGIARSSTEHFGMIKVDLACTSSAWR